MQFTYSFSEPLLEELQKVGIPKSFKEDEILIDLGQEFEFMPLILQGSVKVLMEDKEGDELLLYYLEAGDTCAVTLNCCTKKTKSTIRAVSEGEVEVLLVPVEYLEKWMENFPDWRNFILESYNNRLSEMLDAIDSLVFTSLEDRLKKYLKEKSLIQKSMTIGTSHSQIANDLHSSRVVITRLMKKLEKEGLIKQHRNRVEYLGFV